MPNFEKAILFLENLVLDLDIDTGFIRFALVTFSDEPKVIFKFGEVKSRSEMIVRIKKMDYTRGTTNTADSIKFSVDNVFDGNRRDVQKIIIILTDGDSNNPTKTLAEAKGAKDSKIHIVAIGVGEWTNKLELDTIASYPSTKNTFHVDKFDNLQNIKDAIRTAICNREFF